jgi:phospholipase C
VTISGTNFLSGATVSFDTSAATSVSVTNGSTITAVTPPHAVGEANVTVKNPDGQSASLAGIINPVPNPGFESGATNWILAGVGGAANVQNNAANAHGGNGYVELSTSVAGNHPVLYSANASNTSQYYPVNSGDIITFGGWGYHVSGNGNARWGIEVSDANKAHAVYVSAAPYNVTTSSWINFQSSYTVPSGMAFIRFYCEINTSTGPSVDRFDDAFLQRTMPGGGFTYLVTSNPAPTLSSINPQSGGTAGGTSVTLSGSNFISGASVTFDGIAATSVNFSSPSTITAVTPPHAAGVANVTVTNPDGQSATLTGTISPLSNVGFESGAVNWALSGSGGAAAIRNNAANAHSGSEYSELSTSVAGNHPVMYAANTNNVPQYFPVQPGDVITFGGWGYHVSGDGKARWGIEVSDANKANAVYVAASPFNVNTASWLNFQSSYTVPSGMAFVRFYCEITGTTGPAVDRFDDALLQIVTPSGGFTYVASSGGPPAIGSLSATQGISTGGDTITISGSGFATGATVTFGGTPATTTTVVSSTQIRVVTPASTPGSADVTVTNPDGQSSTLMSLLHNQSFESGISYWGTAGSGGTRTVGATTANAHIGTHYLEMASTGGSSHPVEYASTAAGASLYFPVTASQVVTFGGYAYRVSGGSQVRFGLEITDANKANATYVSAPPYSAWDPLWTLEQGTYTVPAGKSFVRLYAEVAVGTTATVGRFDDAFLQIGSGNSSGFLFFPPPIVTSVSPNWGAPAGGTTRTIYGTGFRAGATVSFGNLAASNVQVVNANAIEVFAPAASAGSVSVKVQQGSATGSLQNAYSYAVPPAPPASMLALKHIIFTLEENRSFDNYFSKMNEYRQMNGVNDNAVDERNDAIALPDIAGNPVTPYHAQTACQENLSPSWNSEHFDYNNGKMDNFLKAGNDIGFSTFDPNGTRAISYYDWTDLPYYYNLAFLFGTSDKWFSPLLGSTDPNRMYYVGATSLGWTAGPHPPTGGFPNFTIFDLLDQAGISWKYYYQFAAPLHLPYWAIYQRDGSKVVPITQYFEDVKSESTLPAVVFIEEGEYNEHPEPNPGTNGQTQSVQQGAAIIKSFVDALMQSPTWKTSAFIVSYDEGGGFHDHVVPPAALAPDGIPPILTIGQDASGLFNQLGLRVPVIVVSPWTPAHLVSHVVRDHTAVLKLIETRFSLPPLTARDAASDNMSEFFNFASPPYMTPPTVSAQPTSEACNLSIEASPNQ